MDGSHSDFRSSDPLGPDALDFWLGDWVVTWADGGRGTNSVRRVCDGRVIEESFDAGDADGTLLGRSLSVLDGSDGRWRQTWVDSNGTYLDLVGVESDSRISFQRETVIDSRPVVQRMVWLDVETDSFRWQWQRSSDDGASWEVVWEIDYRRS
jgi:hypothetical protein